MRNLRKCFKMKCRYATHMLLLFGLQCSGVYPMASLSHELLYWIVLDCTHVPNKVAAEWNTIMVKVHTGQAEEYNTNLGVVSHLLTPVTAPTGLKGQQSTMFSQLGSCMPPHISTSSTVSEKSMWVLDEALWCVHALTVPALPIGKDFKLQTRNSRDTQGDYFCLLLTKSCEIVIAK